MRGLKAKRRADEDIRPYIVLAKGTPLGAPGKLIFISNPYINQYI